MVHRRPGGDSLWIGALDSAHGPLRRLRSGRPAGRLPDVAAGLAGRRAATGNRAFYAVTERGRRRIEELEPAHLRPGHRVGRPLAHADLQRQRGPREPARPPAQGAGRAGLGAALVFDLDFAGRYARGGAGRGRGDSARSTPSTSSRARYCGPLGDRELLERCWDVGAIAAAYARVHRPIRAARWPRERDRAGLSDEEAFVERLWLVHDYRKFVYVDPGLPSELLPAHWPGTAAAALFREYYAAVDAKSMRYFDRCVPPAVAGRPGCVEATRHAQTRIDFPAPCAFAGHRVVPQQQLGHADAHSGSPRFVHAESVDQDGAPRGDVPRIAGGHDSGEDIHARRTG